MTVYCKKGFEISGSIDHKVLVLNDSFDLEYKELRRLTITDKVAIRHGFNSFGDNDNLPDTVDFVPNWRTKDCLIPTKLTKNLAYWMGLVVGDGCLSINKTRRKQRVSFVSEDQDLLETFKAYLIDSFVIDKNEHIGVRLRKNNTYEIEYYCTKLISYLLQCGFTKTTALDKSIPKIIKCASKDNVVAFLQALYDTDGCVYVQGKGNSCEIAFNTSSKVLAKEVQATLLNLGIVSNFGVSSKQRVKQLPQGNKLSKCAESYKVRVTGIYNVNKFRDVIGFRCHRKQLKLNDYLNSVDHTTIELPRLLGLSSKSVNENKGKCEEYLNTGIYFTTPVEFSTFKAETIDVEVENEHCYWANGFINHNSKMIFSEVEKLYDQSYIFREACAKRPTRGTDSCFLKLKSVGGRSGSYIESLPLGDGNKIRGSRFYLILVDELAQVPDTVLDMVLRPMGATSLAPMERVRRLEEQKRLIESGFATKEDFDEEKVNKMIMSSSGYYKFNHMWRRMRDYWRMMDQAKLEKKECPYSVWQVPYWDLPEGFLDVNNIAEAKRIMSSSEYSMEYEAQMISDSEGFFKASLLEECTRLSDFEMAFQGTSTGNYVIGVDPNQGGKASCGMVVIEMGKPNKIVNVIELKKETTQGLTKMLQELCSTYNVVRVFMDRGGGGKAICDLLEAGYHDIQPIIDRTNPDHDHLEGRHILEMVNFNPVWISDANFTTKAMLEDKSLLFPILPINTISDSVATSYKSVETLKSQMLSIVVSQTPTGSLHFDTPSKHMNKDLYSALILAAHGVRTVEKELEAEEDPILFGHGGMVRPRTTGFSQASFNFIGSGNISAPATPAFSLMGLHNAVLKVKKK